MSAKTSARQRAWMQKVQERISAISGILADMKGVKLLALGRTVLQKATGLREVEVVASQGYRTLLMWSLFIGMISHEVLSPDRIATELLTLLGCMPQFMSSALTFAVFAIISAATHEGTLLVAQAFTSLSLISLLTFPLNQLVQAAPQLLACSACFGRIQDFLDQPEKEDVGELDLDPSVPDTEEGLRDNDHNDEHGDQSEKPNDGPSFSAISIHDASFAWSSSARPPVREINLAVPVGSIEVLLGAVGSGKSTLLQGVLGNARIVSGSLQVAPLSLSYCGQTSWLMSGTIRDNIIAGSRFEPQWYAYTLWACSLNRDLQFLSNGDLSEVASNGSSLSGGQKQRIVGLSVLT